MKWTAYYNSVKNGSVERVYVTRRFNSLCDLGKFLQGKGFGKTFLLGENQMVKGNTFISFEKVAD